MRDRIGKLRWETAVIALLVLTPIAFNAIMLLPEIRLPIASKNDDAWHYMFVQRASAALAEGSNPFDFWVPELGLGFPQFLYYQHLPHLAVVLLHRLLLKQVDLLTLFNLVRYLLLVGFPLTVYWSMRTMEFPPAGAAVAAAFASLLSAEPRTYGFSYDSYTWIGNGMYTQLWAMHLVFILVGCVWRLLTKGTGYLAAVVVCSALVLSHALYAYLSAATVLLLLLVSSREHYEHTGENPEIHVANIPKSVAGYFAAAFPGLVRLALVGVLAAAITAYFWLPFFLQMAYFNLIWLQPEVISGRMLNGRALAFSAIAAWWHLLDYGRFPVVTLMVVVGAVYAGFKRTTHALLALTVFGFWLVLYMVSLTLPSLVAFVPLHGLFQYRRLSGEVGLSAILLIGLGGEWLWRQFASLAKPWNAVAPGLIILIWIAPALNDRCDYYTRNARMMEQVSLEVEPGLQSLVDTLKTLTPGRTTGAYWDEETMLTSYDVVRTGGGQHLSLNSPVQLDRYRPASFDLLNARYAVMPSGFPAPAFLSPITTIDSGVGRPFTLYRAETSGYAQFVAVRWGVIQSQALRDAQEILLKRSYAWFHSSEPGAGSFIRWNYPPGRRPPQGEAGSGSPSSGAVKDERVFADRIDLTVDCREAATLVIKVTYHPGWHVTIDGREQATFMVSPSYIGLEVPAGHHEIHAEYRSSRLKKFLLWFSALSLIATIALRRRMTWIETVVLQRPWLSITGYQSGMRRVEAQHLERTALSEQDQAREEAD